MTGAKQAHESPRPAFFARSLEYDRGEDTGWHVHDHCQFVYAVAGAMTVETGHGLWVVPPLRAVWIPDGISHRVVMNSRVSMRTVFFDRRQNAQLQAEKIWGDCVVVPVSPLLRELIVSAAASREDDLDSRKFTLVRALIIEELKGSEVLPLDLPQPADRRLRRITDAIQSAPSIADTLAVLGKTAGASPRTLSRLFLKETGLTFAQWRQQAILINALQRLACGEAVSSIALDLGYNSPSAFTHMFRHALGCNPSCYFNDK